MSSLAWSLADKTRAQSWMGRTAALRQAAAEAEQLSGELSRWWARVLERKYLGFRLERLMEGGERALGCRTKAEIGERIAELTAATDRLLGILERVRIRAEREGRAKGCVRPVRRTAPLVAV